ncbi:hypothetical protein FVE85_8266 [Porphyridium purpureum]|uniref:Uncharacterized protein n=1 Tax=Porphyridium purpureum TaxID=35688 RepID=A0A5J4YM48_PORPP|nr:hypothetical protein FVE85_8266 [Porphyridium purpureum]|eukprot:POR6166..scf244_11
MKRQGAEKMAYVVVTAAPRGAELGVVGRGGFVCARGTRAVSVASCSARVASGNAHAVVMKGGKASKKEKKGAGTQSSSANGSPPATGFGKTNSAVKQQNSGSGVNGAAAAAAADKDIVTRVGGDASEESKPAGEEQQEHELHVDRAPSEQIEHPLYTALQRAEMKQKENPFRLREMSAERYEELQFSPGVKVSDIVAKMEALFVEEGEDALIEWLTANRWVIRYRTSVALTVATRNAEGSDSERSERLQKIHALCVEVRVAYDRPFARAVKDCEKVVKEAVEHPGDIAKKIEKYLTGKSRIELNAMWTVLYSALAAWNDIAARLGQDVVRRDMVDALREAAGVFDSSTPFNDALAPECVLLQEILNATSKESRQSLLTSVTDDTMRNMFLLLAQLERFPFRSYGGMTNSIVQIVEALMKRKYGVVESLAEISQFDQSQSVIVPDSEKSMMALFSRDMSADDAIRLGAKIRAAQAKNKSMTQ